MSIMYVILDVSFLNVLDVYAFGNLCVPVPPDRSNTPLNF